MSHRPGAQLSCAEFSRDGNFSKRSGGRDHRPPGGLRRRCRDEYGPRRDEASGLGCPAASSAPAGSAAVPRSGFFRPAVGRPGDGGDRRCEADQGDTKLTILWMAPSIKAAEDAQNKNMDDWAKGRGGRTDQGQRRARPVGCQAGGQCPDQARGRPGQPLRAARRDQRECPDGHQRPRHEIGTAVGGWYDGPKSVAVRGGQWKALPAAIYGQYWITRQVPLPAGGVDKWPTTYEDLHQAGKKLKTAGTPVGHTLGHAVTDGATHNYSLMWSYGAKEMEADGKTWRSTPRRCSTA